MRELITLFPVTLFLPFQNSIAHDTGIGTPNDANVRNETITYSAENANSRQRIGVESGSGLESSDLIYYKITEVIGPQSRPQEIEELASVNSYHTKSDDSLNALIFDTEFVLRSIEDWLKICPITESMSKTRAKCRQCGGEFCINSTQSIKEHIFSELHLSFSPESIDLVQKRVSKLMRRIEKVYPFLKVINKYGNLNCGICGGQFDIAARGIASLKEHFWSKEHEHCESVEKVYPFLKYYPFIKKTSSDDVVFCEWCKQDLNIACNGGWVIVWHTTTEKHLILAEKFNSSTGSSGLGKNAPIFHLLCINPLHIRIEKSDSSAENSGQGAYATFRAHFYSL